MKGRIEMNEAITAVKAAEQMADDYQSYFYAALIVGLFIIVVLLLKGLLWFLKRDVTSAVKKQDKLCKTVGDNEEKQGIVNQKVNTTLDRMLSKLSGSEDDISRIQGRLDNGTARFVEQDKKINNGLAGALPTSVFNDFQKDHKSTHDKLDKNLGQLQITQAQTHEEISIVGAKMEQGFKTLTDIVVKHLPLVGEIEEEPE